MFGSLEMELILHYLEHYGLYFFFLLVFLEYLKFPVLPSGIVLPATGILLAQGNTNFIFTVGVSMVAGLGGSLLSYFIGYFLGKPMLEKICKKSKGMVRVTETVQSYIDKYGNKGLLLIRFIPVARTLSSVIAGTMHIKLSSFVLYSTIGIFLWNTIYMSMGYLVGILFL